MNILLAVLFTILQMGDAYTTIRILKAGGRELNPVMRAVMGQFGYSALILLKAILCMVVFVIIWHWPDEIIVSCVLIGLNVFYLVIVIRNFKQMR